MAMLELLQLTERLAYAEELLLHCFSQSCHYKDEKYPEFKYDHMCLSAYEHTQDYLIEHDLIKKEECSRK